MRLGIVGLPNVGKSTLFNAVTKSGAGAGNHPFSTVTPNVALVSVPDERLDFLEKLYSAKKNTPATVEFVDIAGLVKGSSRGSGLGNKFLQYIREVDALVHVVRCFEDENIVHAAEDIDAARDIETVNLELILADMEVVERRLAKESKLKANDRAARRSCELLEFTLSQLEAEKRVRDMDFSALSLSPDDVKFIAEMSLLTQKPVLYAANIGEDDLADVGAGNENVRAVHEVAVRENTGAFAVCAKIEEELSALPDDERRQFLLELGCGESGLEHVIKASYAILGLISFLTAGPKEVRAWTVRVGSKAPQAAGKIHSDLERGFIRAEVVHFDELRRLGTHQAAKEAGLVRSEGREYVIKDGDVVLFRFNV